MTIGFKQVLFNMKILIAVAIVFTALMIYNMYPEDSLPENTVIDYLIVYKSKHHMMAYSHNKLVKTYKVSFGDNPVGDKQFEGDEKTPEGLYTINTKNSESGYHKNLGISYPNQQDLEYARSIGKAAGGDIKIHGLRNGLGFINKLQRWVNWTNGCIAVTDSEMDELFAAVRMGTHIEINP